jgi:hypothetical protein
MANSNILNSRLIYLTDENTQNFGNSILIADRSNQIVVKSKTDELIFFTGKKA